MAYYIFHYLFAVANTLVGSEVSTASNILMHSVSTHRLMLSDLMVSYAPRMDGQHMYKAGKYEGLSADVRDDEYSARFCAIEVWHKRYRLQVHVRCTEAAYLPFAQCNPLSTRNHRVAKHCSSTPWDLCTQAGSLRRMCFLSSRRPVYSGEFTKGDLQPDDTTSLYLSPS